MLPFPQGRCPQLAPPFAFKGNASLELPEAGQPDQAARSQLPNMTVLSVSLLLGEAISRIHTGESIGAMFGAPV